MTLLGGVFGSGVAWPMSMYGWTIENFLYGIGNGIVLATLVGLAMAVGVYASRLRAYSEGDDA
jgi:phosphate/sulfate permease